MATALTAFLPSIRTHVPGCPESLMIDALRGACIRFCVDTWITREDLPDSDVLIGVDDYTMTASSDKDVVGIVSYVHDSIPLDFKTKEELDIIDQGWRTADPGVAFYVMAPEPNRILLNRVPAETITGGMKVEIATRPLDAALVVDDLLYNEWREAIKYGALEELKEIPDKGWSSEKQSLDYGRKFNFQIQRGKARARMGHMRKSTTAVRRSWV